MSDSDTDRKESIAWAVAHGKPLSEIARLRGLTVAEVKQALDVEAHHLFSGQEMRRAIAVEAQQLHELKQRHFDLAIATDSIEHSEMYRKLQERFSSLLCLSAPQSFAVTLAQTAAPPEETSTQHLRRIFEEVQLEMEAKHSNGGES
jgi:hypothetical protein